MVEPERVGSFGCRPQRKLSKLLIFNLTTTATSNKSPKTPKSNSFSASPKTPNISPPGAAGSSSSPRTSSLRSREHDYKEVFRRLDKDKNGKISAVELRSYFGSVGEYISHEDAEAVIAELDTDGDNLIDFLDFMRLMNKEEKDQDDDDLKKAFEMFEMEKGSGRITPQSLQRALSRLGEVRTYEECVNMIQVYDTDGKGVLRFHDFQQMMLA